MTQSVTSSQATDLAACVTQQREHVLGILANLPEEAMVRPLLPSGWTCAGLVLDAVRELIDGTRWMVLPE